MNKHIFALAATALLSLNASASYTRYDFVGPAEGYIVQHDDDLSIADFNIAFPVGRDKKNPATYMDIHPIRGYGYLDFYGAFTHFKSGGPTGFAGYTDDDGTTRLDFRIEFSKAPYGRFAYTIDYAGRQYLVDGSEVFDGETNPYMKWYKGQVKGQVTARPLDADEAFSLDMNGGYHDFFRKHVPTYIGPYNRVPEPGNFALLGIAAVGAALAMRRGKRTA